MLFLMVFASPSISQHSPVPINTAICQKPSRSGPFSNTATTPVSIMSTHLSPSEPIMLHNRLNSFDVYRQHNQFTPSSPENSPTMSSFSEVGEDTSCPNSYSTKDPRFQRRIDNMQSYLDESTRLIQCPQPKDGTRPHEEARAIQDQSQPLLNLYNFEALLHGSGSETEEDSTSNSTTFDINQEMYSKCTLDKCDSATTDLDQKLSIGTSEAQQYLPFEIGHTHGRMPEEPQSTGGRRPSASDSGFFDDSFSQESPLMGSPETFFEDWPRVGKRLTSLDLANLPIY
ncbi:hypothetical protein BDD12DRAFT_303655 [Trichophaea hybrida]|nr:hypothetical protein BDD12DRAFT_303655 [Trichophaea hybrida]